MPQWPEIKTGFAAAVLRPETPAPASLARPSGVAPVRRFNVYRNNVASGLIGALSATFPVISALLGPQRFAAIAREFTGRDLPKSPVLAEYGGEFPTFLTAHEVARDLLYLADVARLEWAWLCAWHAADAPPLAIDAFARIAEPDLPGARIDLHPAAGVVASQWPIVSIWQAHHEDDPHAALRNLPMAAECALVTRPALAVEVRRLPPGGAVFIMALKSGDRFAEAAEKGAAAAAAFDLAAAIGGLFEAGAVVAVKPGGTR